MLVTYSENGINGKIYEVFVWKDKKCLIYKFRGSIEIRVGHKSINAKNSIVSDVTLKEGTNMILKILHVTAVLTSL